MDNDSGKECKKAECGKGGGLTCPLTGCPVKHVLLAFLVVFIISFGFDFIFHGMFMKPHYEATAALWRPEAEMQDMMALCLLYHAVFSLGVASLYCLLGKCSPCGGKCPKTGLKFGILLGLILGIDDFAGYIWLPLPDMNIPLYWLAGRIVWGAAVGFALSCACCMMKKDCSANG